MTYKILLLDDDERFRKLVTPGLLAKGFEVVEACDGHQALELVNRSKYDLMIVDGVLPDTEGIKWLTRYRASGGTAALVFVSVHWQTLEFYQVLTKDLNVAQIIHKPVIPSVFAEQVYSEITRPQWTPASTPAVDEQKEAPDETIAYSLAELAREYILELPEELDKISDGVSEAECISNPGLALKSVRMLAHKLRGTAGTFGLNNLGELMGRMEDSIRLQEAKAELPTQEFLDDLKFFLSEGRKVVAEHEKCSSGYAGKSGDQITSSNLRILVVDEDREFLEEVKRVASQRLIEVLPASTPEEVLEILGSTSVDAILIEVKLAGYKSFELARTIRDLTSESIPIAFVSDDTNLDDRLLAAHLGASLYLNKPIDPDTLEDAIQRLLLLRSTVHPKILVVDDDQYFAKRASKILSTKGMDVQILSEPARILDKLQEFAPDLLILDLMMPFISGFDICKMLRTMPRWQDLPILFVTAQTGLATRLAAFTCGADDYLPKPVADDELVTRVTMRVERSRFLKDRSERDPLTGLLIRRGFMERFNAALGNAKRISQSISLVLFDLDKFKQINDKYGHLAGDSVLSGLGRLMSKRFRVEDLRGRWGGDEFVIGFVGSDRQHSVRLMESILAEYSAMTFVGEHGEVFSAALSAGIACFPDDCDNTYDLLRIADQRLYEAKSQGRNRVVADSPDLLNKGK